MSTCGPQDCTVRRTPPEGCTLVGIQSDIYLRHSGARSRLAVAGRDVCEDFVGSVIKKRRKRMAKKKHRKLLRKTRHQRRNKK